MSSKNDEIIARVLGMDEVQLILFMKSLTPDALGYLDIIIAKAEKRYLDS